MGGSSFLFVFGGDVNSAVFDPFTLKKLNET